MVSRDEQERLAAISGQEAWENVSQLIIPMDRWAGSEAEKEGAKKVKDKLASYVDTCEIEDIPVITYVRREGRLQVVSPVELSIPCTPAVLSGSGSGTVTLVDVGTGTKEDYDRLGDEVKGAAVLATKELQTIILQPGQLRTGLETRMLMCMEARHRKAGCFIFNEPEKSDEHEAPFPLNVDFPALIISNRSAAELRELLSQHKEVKVNFESILEYADSTTPNIVGEIRGTQFPDEVIYITSHHDSWYYGANDNISSVACMIETAKMFNKYRPRRTVRFIAFGAEESGSPAEARVPHFGLRGSYGYSEAHQKALQGELEEITIGIINGEFMGYSERMDAMCSADLLPVVREAAADLGHYARATEPLPWYDLSDHWPFHTLGVPSVLFWITIDSPFYSLYHSAGDNMDIIESSALAKNASLMALLGLRLDSTDVPYSLERLRDAGLRGIECLPNCESIRRVFDEKVTWCLETKQREERLKQSLAIGRAVNTNLYTHLGLTVINKLEVICDAIAKLRNARNIIDVEDDVNRASAVLSTIEGAAKYINFSTGVTEHLDGLVERSEWSTRMSPYILDLQSIFQAIHKKESPKDILARIESKLEEALKTAKEWGTNYEDSLRGL